MKRRNWTVTLGAKRFSMGGEWMTPEEALAVAQSIWPDAEVE